MREKEYFKTIESDGEILSPKPTIKSFLFFSAPLVHSSLRESGRAEAGDRPLIFQCWTTGKGWKIVPREILSSFFLRVALYSILSLSVSVSVLSPAIYKSILASLLLVVLSFHFIWHIHYAAFRLYFIKKPGLKAKEKRNSQLVINFRRDKMFKAR